MRLNRLLPAALLAIGLSGAGVPATWAGPDAVKFSQAAFSASQQAGKPILVEITAPWCPVCAKQRPILAQLLTEPAFEHLVRYHIDFDSQKDAIREMGANMQSTLIVFNGGHEEGRSTGVTDPGAIKALLAKAAG